MRPTPTYTALGRICHTYMRGRGAFNDYVMDDFGNSVYVSRHLLNARIADYVGASDRENELLVFAIQMEDV